jgi:hypothetical protein
MLILVLPAATAIAFVVVLQSVREGKGPSRPPNYAELVAKNYRVLTKEQSQTLVHFASEVHRCLLAQGVKIAPPVASRTQITMQAPHQSAQALVRSMLGCDSAVDAPPANGTLQARPGRVLIYLPKQCLLAPTKLDTT